MTPEKIISLLPYGTGFLFVDTIERVDENSIEGNYTFKENEFFYKGHFRNLPITPGVILTETMAQIGLVCLGIYIIRNEIEEDKLPLVLMTSANVNFLLPVYPLEKVTVVSEKIYFRFGKLKCNIQMMNANGNIVSKGEISGMIKKYTNE